VDTDAVRCDRRKEKVMVEQNVGPWCWWEAPNRNTDMCGSPWYWISQFVLLSIGQERWVALCASCWLSGMLLWQNLLQKRCHVDIFFFFFFVRGVDPRISYKKITTSALQYLLSSPVWKVSNELVKSLWMNLFTNSRNVMWQEVCYWIVFWTAVTIFNVTCLSHTDKKAEYYVVCSNFKRNEDGIFNFDSISANVKS